MLCLYVRSMGNRDLDISYITSRLIVMSYPAEGIESAYRNHLDDVRGQPSTALPSFAATLLT